VTERVKVKRIFDTPTSRRVDELYAWMTEDPNHRSEGLVGANIGPGGSIIPLVGGDLARMRSLRCFVEGHRAATGWRVQLLRFSRRDELEELP
jgi:hypothetical protein